MQDFIERLQTATRTPTLNLWFTDDLVNACEGGARVRVTGVVRLRPMKENKRLLATTEKFLDVLHVEKLDEQYDEILIPPQEAAEFDALAKRVTLIDELTPCVAPSIYGMDKIKEAILLQALGGTPKDDEEGIRRADFHILLIGDPGVGKSGLVNEASKIFPKSVRTVGMTASGVGLIASVETDEITGARVLHAGAVVLASGGVVVIDEADKLDPEDREKLHEVMEQQTASIHKAKFHAELVARTSVLAAANPKFGQFDRSIPYSEQFGLEPAFLSRFDLIFCVTEEELDAAAEDERNLNILRGKKQGGTLSPEKLKRYIAYARRKVQPELSPEAERRIADYYKEMADIGKKNRTLVVTKRQLKALGRISEAYAKLRLSPIVEKQDADKAVELVDYELHKTFTDASTGKIDLNIVDVPTSLRDKYEKMDALFDAMASEVDNAFVDQEMFFARCKEYSLTEKEAKRWVDEKNREGDIYSPKTGYLKRKG